MLGMGDLASGGQVLGMGDLASGAIGEVTHAVEIMSLVEIYFCLQWRLSRPQVSNELGGAWSGHTASLEIEKVTEIMRNPAIDQKLEERAK